MLRPGITLLLATSLCVVPACAPSDVQTQDVDMALSKGEIKTACAALDMEDPDMRTYATRKLQEVQDPAAAACVCARVVREGRWDPAVAKGMEKSKRDDMVACLGDVLLDQAQVDRKELADAVARTSAPMSKKKLAEVAGQADETAVRVRAVRSLSGTTEPEYLDLLLKLLADDKVKEVRAAAAEALANTKDPRVDGALHEALVNDPDAITRSALLVTLYQAPAADAVDLVCKAMMDDPAPEVRAMAVSLLRGTKDEKAIGCLKKRVMTREDDGTVRERMLEVVKSSPTKEASNLLCDAIPFWLQTYAVDNLPEKIKGANISKAQNDRDWQRSYECFGKAYAKRGSFSCFGKQHIAWWYHEVGAKVPVPACPGSPSTTEGSSPSRAPRRSGGGEVEAEGVNVSG